MGTTVPADTLAMAGFLLAFFTVWTITAGVATGMTTGRTDATDGHTTAFMTEAASAGSRRRFANQGLFAIYIAW